MKLLQDKVVVITGGAQGIGRECALAYVREGAFAVVLDNDAAALESMTTELGDGGLAISCDVSRSGSVQEAIGLAHKKCGHIDSVHNNAGITGPSLPLDETGEEEWDRLMTINLKSVYLTTRHAIEALKASKGSILNTASLVGLIGQDNHAAYVASKGGMIALTKAMALDYAPFGIRVNAVCPAGIWTPMLRQWAREQPDPGHIEKYLNDIHPLGYCPEGDVIADIATFLLSDKARFMTGAIVPVSGGAELGYRR